MLFVRILFPRVSAPEEWRDAEEITESWRRLQYLLVLLPVSGISLAKLLSFGKAFAICVLLFHHPVLYNVLFHNSVISIRGFPMPVAFEYWIFLTLYSLPRRRDSLLLEVSFAIGCVFWPSWRCLYSDSRWVYKNALKFISDLVFCFANLRNSCYLAELVHWAWRSSIRVRWLIQKRLGID